MTNEEVLALIQRTPSVHRLCYGVFLQSPLWISEDVIAVPLQPLGFDAEFGHVATYLLEFFGVRLTPDEMERGRAQGIEALPVITVICFPGNDGSPQELETKATPKLQRAEQLIAWLTGNELTEFAYISVNSTELPYFRLVPPLTRRRLRLGLGNVGDDLKGNIDRIRAAADDDPRFAFAMSLFTDATRELNPIFKICRLFNVLESLAYALKTAEIGSRRAVKVMLGLEDGALCSVTVDERAIKFDRIEIAGRLRDKYFHGTPFRESDLIAEARPAFHLMEHHPSMIADMLVSDCELAFARWANDASPARNAATAIRNR